MILDGLFELLSEAIFISIPLSLQKENKFEINTQN